MNVIINVPILLGYICSVVQSNYLFDRVVVNKLMLYLLNHCYYKLNLSPLI